LTNLIKRVVDGLDEKNYAAVREPVLQSTGAMTPIKFNSGIASVAEIYNLVPPVSQGSDTNVRKGQKIKPTALVTKLTFSMLGEDQNARSIMVRCMILTSKAVKDPGNYTAVPVDLLLDPGNGEGGLTTFNGYLQDVMCPINNESLYSNTPTFLGWE